MFTPLVHTTAPRAAPMLSYPLHRTCRLQLRPVPKAYDHERLWCTVDSTFGVVLDRFMTGGSCAQCDSNLQVIVAETRILSTSFEIPYLGNRMRIL